MPSILEAARERQAKSDAKYEELMAYVCPVEARLTKMKLPQLKEEAAANGLPTNGRKADLIDRLLDTLPCPRHPLQDKWDEKELREVLNKAMMLKDMHELVPDAYTIGEFLADERFASTPEAEAIREMAEDEDNWVSNDLVMYDYWTKTVYYA